MYVREGPSAAAGWKKGGWYGGVQEVTLASVPLRERKVVTMRKAGAGLRLRTQVCPPGR